MGLLHGKVNSKSKDIIINQLLVIQYKFDTKIIYWPSHHRAKQSEASAASPGNTIRIQQHKSKTPLQAELKTNSCSKRLLTGGYFCTFKQKASSKLYAFVVDAHA